MVYIRGFRKKYSTLTESKKISFLNKERYAVTNFIKGVTDRSSESVDRDQIYVRSCSLEAS
jgi:hypothetical protein